VQTKRSLHRRLAKSKKEEKQDDENDVQHEWNHTPIRKYIIQKHFKK
jgi:hypothetical protein